jgi:anti-sigma regulatory factor (Ser/Thr protein kinase)
MEKIVVTTHDMPLPSSLLTLGTDEPMPLPRAHRTRDVLTSSLHIATTLESDPYQAADAVEHLLQALAEVLHAQETEDLRLVLSELLLNAIEHGNLEISGAQKRQALEEGTFAKLVQERRASTVRRQRKVWVTLIFEQTSQRLYGHIRDEGAGFQWRALPQEITPDHFTLPHGRGILLSRMLVDQLTYNDSGNEVTVVKQFTAVR